MPQAGQNPTPGGIGEPQLIQVVSGGPLAGASNSSGGGGSSSSDSVFGSDGGGALAGALPTLRKMPRMSVINQ